MKISLEYIKENNLVGYDMIKALKESYMNAVDKMIKDNRRDSKSFGNVTFFHGTTFKNLNNILVNGLLPREASCVDGNYTGHLESHPGLTYLTNKWHYRYALMGMDVYKNENAPVENAYLLGDTPCYIEVEARHMDLIPDEDYILTPKVIECVKEALTHGHDSISIKFSECLANFGTVAHFGSIPPEAIKSFTILGNLDNFFNVIIAGQYSDDITRCLDGNGVGKLNANDLCGLEAIGDENKNNATYWVTNVFEKINIKDTYNKRLYISHVKKGYEGLPMQLIFKVIDKNEANEYLNTKIQFKDFDGGFYT